MTVMTARAAMAARKTVSLLLRMARMAAMKKVLSPSSETRMTESDEAVQEAFVLRGVELQLEVVVVVVDHGGGAVEDEIRIRG